jgi:hypothetical protein
VRPHHLAVKGIVGLDALVDELANTVLSWKVCDARMLQ